MAVYCSRPVVSSWANGYFKHFRSFEGTVRPRRHLATFFLPALCGLSSLEKMLALNGTKNFRSVGLFCSAGRWSSSSLTYAISIIFSCLISDSHDFPTNSIPNSRLDTSFHSISDLLLFNYQQHFRIHAIFNVFKLDHNYFS